MLLFINRRVGCKLHQLYKQISMNNNSGLGESPIKRSDTHIDYLTIEKDQSAREESLRNFSFDGGNKNHQEQAITFLNKYTPLSQTFPLQVLKQSPHLRAKHYKESTYYGEMQNGKKHSYGIMVYLTGKKYQGQWQNDKKAGQGTEVFPNKCIYTGQYQQGKPNGEGNYLWPSGECYKGCWRNGERHGSGKWQAADRSYYEGEWRFGKPQGFGVYVSANGTTYEGEFKASLKHGEGLQKFANGDLYRGSYINGKPSGIGAYYWFNGSYFKGNFLNGLRDGKGLWKRGVGNSDKYEGNYKSDRKSGYGEFAWTSGNVYKGHYEADSRNGYGEMYWTNGACYKGNWLDGVQHGYGEIHVPGLGYRKGKFDNNVLVELVEQNLVQNSFRQAHRNQKPNKSSAIHTSFMENQTVSRASFRSKKKDRLIRTKNVSKYSNLHETSIHNPSQKSKAEKTQIQDATQRITPGFPRSRRELTNKLQDQIIVQQHRPTERAKISTNKTIAKSFTRSGNSRNYNTLDSRYDKKDNMFNNFFQNSKAPKSIRNDTFQKGSRSPTQNRNVSKDRLLHSSFYLYKLRQRQIPETAPLQTFKDTLENPLAN